MYFIEHCCSGVSEFLFNISSVLLWGNAGECLYTKATLGNFDYFRNTQKSSFLQQNQNKHHYAFLGMGPPPSLIDHKLTKIIGFLN